MKIELLTMHRIVNYGSVLQAFATQKVLEDMGYEVEILDYYPERYHALGMLRSIKKKVNGRVKCIICCAILIPSYMKRFRVFRKFITTHLQLSPFMYVKREELIENFPKTDIYCTGSDQVWNSTWSEGLDLTYYFDFLPDNIPRISYAASIGKESIEMNEIAEIKPCLERYSWISVREQSAKNILNNIGFTADLVLDPTLLLNYHQWETLISDRFAGRKYILVYNLNREKKVDVLAKEIQGILGLQLYYVGYAYHEAYKGNRYFCNPSVEDFLSLLVYADFVIGDSFHITAFSINFHKQFIAVGPRRFSTRIRSLLQLLGAEDRYLANEEKVPDRERLEKMLKNKMDYYKIEGVLNENREFSRTKLREELDKVGKISS